MVFVMSRRDVWYKIVLFTRRRSAARLVVWSQTMEMSFYVRVYHLSIVWVRGARVRRDARDGGGALPASRDALRDRGDGLDGHVRGVDLHHAG